MSKIRTLISCILEPRIHSFHRLTGNNLAYSTSEVLNHSHKYGPSSIESESDHAIRTPTFSPFSKVDSTNKSYLEELKPPQKKSFNLAAYVNESNTLQQFIKLGVSLYDIENTNTAAARLLLKLDFEKDCVEHIKFLVKIGVKEKNLGRFITEYPMVFSEDLENLQIRLNYFESKGFTEGMIKKALNRSALFLSHKTKTTDFMLAQLQIEFNLPARVLRLMVIQHPAVISIPSGQYKLVNFTLNEEFGFKLPEIHQILSKQPQILELTRPILIDRLDLVHNDIGLSHRTITMFPKLITGPKLEIEHRAKYLKKLNRAQFDPKQPLYVPPTALYRIDSEEFCLKYAKTSLDDYKLFLKSC